MTASPPPGSRLPRGGRPPIRSASHGRSRRSTAGFTLLEVLIATALLGMIAGFLLQLRVDALRHEAAQRRHVVLTQWVRSEAEALRAGMAPVEGGSAWPCTTASPDPASAPHEGYACHVQALCAFPPAMCGAAGLRALVIRASDPLGASLEVALLVPDGVQHWVVASR